MSFLTGMLKRIMPQLEADPLFAQAVSAFKVEPTPDNFEAVAQHVAYVASPDADNELGGRFNAANRPIVATEFFYIALTERVLGVTGWLDRAIAQSDHSGGDWLDDRHLLVRAGVSRALTWMRT